MLKKSLFTSFRLKKTDDILKWNAMLEMYVEDIKRFISYVVFI